MKVTSVWVVLECVALVTSAPIILASPQENSLDAPSDPRWKFQLPKFSVETSGSHTTSVSHDTADRPTTPEAVRTEYSTSFTHRRPKGNTETEVDHEISLHRRPDMESVITITGLDVVLSVPESPRLDTPCHLARLSREREDVTIVVLSLVFFLVVVAVESWGYVCQSFRRTVYGHGEIRLEEGGECVGGGLLSVKAEGEEGEVMVEDEKVEG